MSRYKQPYSLYKRGSYWYYRTYSPEGKRTTGISTGKKNKTEAKRFCDNLYLSNALFKNSLRFYEYAVDFYAPDSTYMKDRLTPLTENTIRAYKIRMEQNILPYFKDYKISEIEYTDLKNFRASMINEGYAPSVVNNSMNVLKHIIDSAYRDRLIPSNPFNYLEPLSAPPNDRDAFTFEEVKFVYDNIGAEFQKTVLLMALTGMRISEAIGVTDSDILQGNGFEYIHLIKQFNLKKYKPLKNKLKRDIPITPEIKVLFGFDDTRLSAFYKAFQPVKIQIPDYDERKLSFHSLRHFFITNAKANGCNDLKVEYLAGHTLEKIKKVYTNFKVDDVTEIMGWQKETYKKIVAQIDNLNH